MVTQLTEKEYRDKRSVRPKRKPQGHVVRIRRLICDTLNIKLSTKEKMMLQQALKKENDSNTQVKALKEMVSALSNKVRTLKPRMSNQAIPKDVRDKRWLFVCAYGQSRSRWFSERFMMMGIRSVFCGYEDEADIKFNRDLLEWADKIVCLDKDFHRLVWLDPFISDTVKDKNVWIDFFLDDDPQTFPEKFGEFIHQCFEEAVTSTKPLKHQQDIISWE